MEVMTLEEMLEAAETSQEKTIFQVTDDKSADWTLKKIAEAKQELDRLEEIANAQIAEISAKIEREREIYEGKTRFLKSCLHGYFLTVPHKETKTKESYKLLSGSLEMKKETQKIIHDDDTLLEYCKANGLQEYIKVKESVAWGDLKKQLFIAEDGTVVNKETGDVVDCLGVEVTPEEFDIKF